MRIAIFDESGKYLSPFDSLNASIVWTYGGWHSSSAGGCEHAYSLYRLSDRGGYVWCDTTKAASGEFTKGYFVSTIDAVEHIHGLDRNAPDELLEDADFERVAVGAKSKPERAPPAKSGLIVVFDETTRQERRLDTSAEHWGPIEEGRDWNGFECCWNWTDVETLYRPGKRFVLYTESYHAELDLPAQPTCRILLNEEAVNWIIRNGFDAPPDVAHLATIRSVDEVTDEEIEAARQRESANALTPEEQLELMLPTGRASTAEPTNEETAPPGTEAPVAQPAAVEPATESKAPKRKRQRRELLRGLTPIQIETYQIWAECKGNVSETARRLGKDRKTVQETLDAAKTKLGKNATKHITTGFRHDRRGQADVDADGDRRLA